MKAEQKAELKSKVQFWKSEANMPKEALMRILNRMEELDPKAAKQLGKIIGELEHWQNRKR